MDHRPIHVEIFPKVLTSFLNLVDACGENCLCSGPDMEHVERLNTNFIGMVEETALDLNGIVSMEVYHYASPDERTASMVRLSQLLETQGYKPFHPDKHGEQMLELITPVLAVNGELCSFATYPTRQTILESLSAACPQS